MDLEVEKDSIEVMKAMMRDPSPIADENATAAAHSKKHSKPKKKDSAFLYGNEVADILKSAQTPEQKLSTVCSKYSEQLHTNRKLMMAYKMAEGRIAKMQQDIEQCQQQRSKAVFARSRLENLCRELQKLNKAQKEEIDLKLRLEEEKRKEISATFQSAFAEMNTLTSQNTEKNTKMREENLEMREKIKSVRERIELSEQQLEKVRQQAQLELQLAEAKMAKVKMEMAAEKECSLKEKQQLLLQLTQYQVRITELQANEEGLRHQISMYTEKYDDFQNALTKSNEVFSGFNEGMTKMSKKILKLEKETSQWKQRWEKSNVAVLNMAADKQIRDAETAKLTHKLSLLQELCKAFQRERTELLAQLRAATNSHRGNPDLVSIEKIDIRQVEELSKDCQHLKDNLVKLQGSLAEEIFESKPEQTILESDMKDGDDTKTETKMDSEKVMISDTSSDKSKIENEISPEKKESTTNCENSEVKSEDGTALLSSGANEPTKICNGKSTNKSTIESNEKKDNESPHEGSIEISKSDGEGSECASFEVIDKLTLEGNETASNKLVDLAPSISNSNSSDMKTNKVDELKTPSQISEHDTNIQKEIESNETSTTADEKKDDSKTVPTKRTKDGKRKKK